MADKDAPYRKALSRTLRTGVIASAILLLVGLARGRTEGILLLIATPLAGLVVSGGGYALRQEWKYALLCASLLGMVALGAVLGAAG